MSNPRYRRGFCAAIVLGIGLAASSLPIAADTPAVKPVKPLTIEDFVKPAEMTNMQMSPTGEHLAMTVPLEDGRIVLYIVDAKTRKPTASIAAPGGNVIDEFWWANDTRVVATIAEKLGGIDQPQPNGELYAVNADGSGGAQLFGYRGGEQVGSRIKRGAEKRYASASVVSHMLDDRRRILISVWDWASGKTAIPSIERLDIYSGATSKVGVGPRTGAEVIADHDGKVRVAAALGDDLRSLFYVRDDKDGSWAVYNDSKSSGVVMTPLMFARDNRHLYVSESQSGGAFALYLIDLDNKDPKKLLYRGGADPEQLLVTADGKDAYGVVTADGMTGIEVFDKTSPEGRMTLSLAEAFKGQTVRFTSFSSDGKLGLVRVSSDRNPGDYYLFHMDTKQAEYILSPRSWIDPERMAAMQPFTFTARDGVKVSGYLTVPPGSDGKNLPLIVNPHGGPHGIRDYWGFNPETQLFASHGYAVMQVNFRGSGGYGQGFLESGYRQWGLAMQDDITDATRWAIEKGHADPKRIAIYGGSYGGYAALQGAVREPDLYRAAIGYVGVYDLPLMHKSGDVPKSLYGPAYLNLVLGSDKDDMRRRSPVAGVDKLKAALMLVAGGRDQRVPIAQYKSLTAALDQQKYPYQSLVKDTEGHGFYRTDNNVELYTRMLKFLADNVPAGSAASASASVAAQ